MEFQSREELKRNPVTSLRGWGTYPVPPGTWSDDSSMTWCTIESILEGYDLYKLVLKYLDWYRNGSYTATGVLFDIGIATRRALDCVEAKLEQDGGDIGKVDITLCSGSGEHDNGNGSLMRSAPLVVLLNSLNFTERFELIRENSSITHSHIRSVLACFFFCELLLAMLETKNREMAYAVAVNSLERAFTLEQLSVPTSERLAFKRILSGEILDAEEEEVFSSGYVIHTLESVLWSFYQSNNFEETIFTAVNLGEDTDTVCSLAAQLGASYFPEEQIPQDLLAGVQRIDEVIALAEKLERFSLELNRK
ncbi:ADP-ribosylation/Crystallin J1 [Pontibacter sp. BAB1700]|nr:ADP-ribosylation/Crystallin J1 [Pontibacter sp. BAB1700]